jgi:hypothetical protein
MDKQFTLLRNLIIIVALAVVFSLFTLWLIDSWIKYPLFLFEIFTIIILYLIINGYEIRTVVKFSYKLKLNWGLAVDATLVSSSVALLALAPSLINGGLIRTILALTCTSLLPGYALLNVFGLIRYFTRLESILLSYILSYVYTGLLALVLLPIDVSLRGTTILLSYIVLGVLSIFKHYRHPLTFTKGSLARRVDILVLLLSTAFYALSFYFIYPGFALLPGTDISRHYASSIVLWRTPELYSSFPYFLAHLHESAFIALSNAPVTVVQTTLALLNLMMPIAFYIMAKNYMEGIDERLPAISTIFYSIFSNFAWIWLMELKLEGVQGSTLGLLNMVNDKAYNGAMYFGNPGICLYYVPVSTSFLILLIQFALLKKLEIGKGKFIPLLSILTIASYLTHITEAVIFSIFLCLYAFFSRSKDIRLNDAISSSMIAFIVLDVFYTMLQCLFGKNLGFSINLSLFAPSLLLFFIYIYRRTFVQAKLAELLSKIISILFIRAILYMAIFAYFVGLFVWITDTSFHTWMVVDIGIVPWFIYPVIFGISGILTLISFHYLFEDAEARKRLMLFITLMVSSILIGRLLTVINMNFFDTGYWEKRLTSYSYLSTAVLAPISLVKIADYLRIKQRGLQRFLLIVGLICIIVMYGVQSTFVVLEYWNTVCRSPYTVSNSELEALSFLKNILQHDKYAYVITLTSTSYNMLSFAAPPYKITQMQIFYTAKNPEVPMITGLKAYNLSHAYLYIHSRDTVILDNNKQSWLTRHLLPMLPIVYKNSEATIYNVSSVAFPQIESTTALVVPFDNSVDPVERWLYAYDTLSLGGFNYTVVYDLDPTITSQYGKLILSIDPPVGGFIKNVFEDDFLKDRGWTPFSGTWNYTNEGLEAGKHGEYQDAISLSPLSTRNFTASLTFKLLDGDIKALNYISIIYDWKDQNNYKAGVLLFDSSGNIYTYIVSINGGEGKCYPSWPGFNTGLKWRFGDRLNLTLSVNDNMATIYVNGSMLLTGHSDISGGRLGIRATRFYNVLFTSFKAYGSQPLRLRDPKELMDYVQQGGKLIVLNTNGYGYFAQRLFNITNSTLNITRIGGSESMELPSSLVTTDLSLKKDDTEIIATYTNGKNTIPYIVKENIGSGEIIYVNIYPLIEAIEQSNEKSSWFEFLTKALKPIGNKIERFSYTQLPSYSLVFKEVRMSGNVEVITSSILFPDTAKLKTVNITFNNNTKITLFNVTSLEVLNTNDIYLNGSNLTLSNGAGFYATLMFKDKIQLITKNCSMNVEASDERSLLFNDVKEVTIESDNPIVTYMKQPVISFHGEAIFKEVYSSGPIYEKTRIQGQNLIVNGTISLRVYLSDTYSFASEAKIDGVYKREPSLVLYNELSVLTSTPVISLLLLLLLIILLPILITRKK